MPPLQALERAQELVDAGRPFEAHEVLEAVWKNTTGDARLVWRGLAQICVAITHRLRGNDTGADRLFARAAQNLRDGNTDSSMSTEALSSWADRAADGTRDEPMPSLTSLLG